MRKFVSYILIISMLIIPMYCVNGCLVVSANAASYEFADNVKVFVDNDNGHNLRVISVSYENNAYISLRDLANVLAGTSKKFNLHFEEDGKVDIIPGEEYVSAGTENIPWDESVAASIGGHSLVNTNLKLNGEELRYFTMNTKNAEGISDMYIRITDICMILDLGISVDEDKSIHIKTSERFLVDPQAMEFEGYFQGVNSVLVGDATTGDIYYEYKGDEPFPIASTTKLMTTAILLDEISKGTLSMDDKVTVSKKAQSLADSPDGVVKMKAGRKATIRDLYTAMLLPSSNESACLVAETISGSEEAFVDRMYEKATELGMGTVVFYNSHGLPSYEDTEVVSKKHNQMSSEDMFKLASYLLNEYPEITKTTTIKRTNLQSFDDAEVKCTNALLYNMPGVVTGLKTGTTTRAGACLVTSLTKDINGTKHDLVVVLLGAETSQDRVRTSEVLARYALAVAEGRAKTYNTQTELSSDGHPVNAKGIVELVINNVKKDNR